MKAKDQKNLLLLAAVGGGAWFIMNQSKSKKNDEIRAFLLPVVQGTPDERTVMELMSNRDRELLWMNFTNQPFTPEDEAEFEIMYNTYDLYTI